jgi:hypothetical protein
VAPARAGGQATDSGVALPKPAASISAGEGALLGITDHVGIGTPKVIRIGEVADESLKSDEAEGNLS